MPELTKLDRTKSTIRYFPPKGIAGLPRSRVRGWRRSPRPPAKMNPGIRSRDGRARGERPELLFGRVGHLPGPLRVAVEPDAMVTALAPRPFQQRDGFARGMPVEVTAQRVHRDAGLGAAWWGTPSRAACGL